MSLTKRLLALGLVTIIWLFVALTAVSPRSDPALADLDWRSDWALERGFEIVIDAQGFQLPTSIAFVPDPGPRPKDPLYFVTELQGTIKVVTNDRSVLTFAENVLGLGPDDEPLFQVGMAGMCLDPNHGYVFATFARPDENGVLRNSMVRFQAEPETFSGAPSSKIEFSEVFAAYGSGQEHQIGPCLAKDDLLYVSVGDGSQTEQSQSLDSLLGKVIRMTLDGRPASANPFYQADDIGKAANFVWAYGLRNPFGLKFVGEELFVADNGPAVDRFLRISEGENYLWDGTNLSIGTNAGAVLFPGKGVAQMDYYPAGSNLFPPRFRDSFVLTVSGSAAQELEGVPAIMVLPYDHLRDKLASVPRPLVRYRGGGTQVVAGLAFGQDGLYFAPMLPNENGMTAVLKVRYAPGADYPYLLDAETNPIALMNSLGCFACHTLNNNRGGTSAPVLDRELLVPRIQTRLNSEAYARTVEELDILNQEPFVTFRQAREDVIAAQGLEQVGLWLENRIQEPRFDDPNARMPNQGVSRDQARVIAAYLAGIEDPEVAPPSRGLVRRIIDEVRGWFPTATRKNAERYAAVIFGIGLAVGGIGAFSIHWVYVKFRRRGGNRVM